MLATLAAVALLTSSALAWMNYETSYDNLTLMRDSIRDALVAKGNVLVENHALALRQLVLDNAFADIKSIVDEAVKNDGDLVYGIFLGSDGISWAFAAPGVRADAPADSSAWRVLKLKADDLKSRKREVRQLDVFGQHVYEFSMPVLGESEQDLLGTIRYGLSPRRTEQALAQARARSERDLWRTLGLLGVITLLTMFFGVAVTVRRAHQITRPLDELTQVARTIATGERQVRARIDSGDEIEVLAGAFNQMVSELNESYTHLRGAKDALQSMNETLEQQVAQRTQELKRAHDDLWGEMDLARKIQTVLLPQDTRARECEIGAKMVPADAVGGDYYDILDVDGADWVLIGDVSGHGVTAGLSMMMVQTAVRSMVAGYGADGLAPAQLVTRVNAAVAQSMEKMAPYQYMTIAALRIKGGVVTFAGLHEEIMVYRVKTKVVERFQTQGMWIGLVENVSEVTKDDSFPIEHGDLILLYTDGLTETVLTERKQRLGADGLANIFRELAERTHDVQAILGGLLANVAGADIKDDITAMVIRYAPSS
jgi:serine phosphatase RsbU (regulator of sigma subunit)